MSWISKLKAVKIANKNELRESKGPFTKYAEGGGFFQKVTPNEGAI